MKYVDNIRAYQNSLIMIGEDPLNDEYVFEYLINVDSSYDDFEYEDEVIFKKKVEDYFLLKKSLKFINCNREFVNGYKVVRTLNDEFAYLSEKENKLLPYRYHVATDFNEYGLAMVARDGMVTWINKDFEYFNAKTRSFQKDNGTTLKGYNEVHDFSSGNIPLSKVVTLDEQVSYLKTTGEIMKFKYNLGDCVSSWDYDEFDDLGCENFNDEGYMLHSDGKTILSDDGFILTNEEYMEKKSRKIKLKKIK